MYSTRLEWFILLYFASFTVWFLLDNLGKLPGWLQVLGSLFYLPLGIVILSIPIIIVYRVFSFFKHRRAVPEADQNVGHPPSQTEDAEK